MLGLLLVSLVVPVAAASVLLALTHRNAAESVIDGRERFQY